ncbi:MAG: hypothetical protein U0894_04215 [Pirellulales bacterium]
MGPYSSHVTTVVRTVTVNPAFLQEIKEVHQGLWDALAEMRQRCQRPLAVGMCRHLVNWLEEIRDQLALHFALEEAYGYFEDPVDAAPHLCQMADNLRAQHHDLYQSFCEMLDHADQLLFEERMDELALWLGPAFLTFDRILRRHEALENELIFEAYSDIGGSD